MHENNLVLNHRFIAIDILRVIAVYLVFYAHFIFVAGHAKSIPDVTTNAAALPIFNAVGLSVTEFEIFLIQIFSTQTGILGVSIFFIVTGYLMPAMMERYTRNEFLLNRFFRIFPVLFASMLISMLFLYVTQDKTYSLASFMSSVTLSYLVLGVVPVVGVLWTLVIEVIYYAIQSIIGKLSFNKIFVLQAFIISIIITDVSHPNFYFLHLLSSNLKFLLMILIGGGYT